MKVVSTEHGILSVFFPLLYEPNTVSERAAFYEMCRFREYRFAYLKSHIFSASGIVRDPDPLQRGPLAYMSTIAVPRLEYKAPPLGLSTHSSPLAIPDKVYLSAEGSTILVTRGFSGPT